MTGVRPSFAALGIATSLASLWVPISYGEGEWVAVARRIGAGLWPYSETIGNKPPLVYAIAYLLDVAPGPYAVARALFVGAAAIWFAYATSIVARRLGTPDRMASLLGLAAGASVPIQTGLQLNMETIAASLLFLSIMLIIDGRTTAGAIVAGLTPMADLRTFALGPALMLFCAQWHGFRRARAASIGFAVVAGTWAAVVVFHPDVRYSLLGLNVATRHGVGSWNGALAVLTAAFALLPVSLAFAAAARTGSRPSAQTRSIRASAFAYVGIAALLAIASKYPFPKYWALLLPGAPLLLASIPSRSEIERDRARIVAILMMAALIPTIVSVVGNYDERAAEQRAYDLVARRLDRALPADGTYVAFDTRPFLPALLPGRNAVPWMVLDYIDAETSRDAENLALTKQALLTAGAIVDDGALTVDERSVHDALLPYWRAFRARMPDFSCIERYGRLVVRLRPMYCAR